MRFKFLALLIVSFFGVSSPASASQFHFKGFLRVAVCEPSICTHHPQVDISAPIDFGSCKDNCNASSRARLTMGSYVFEGYIHVFKYANAYLVTLRLNESKTKTNSTFSVELGQNGISDVYNLTGNHVKYVNSGGDETVYVPMLTVSPASSF